MNIAYLEQADIDKEKWDRSIDRAANGLIYAYSFYLDAMSRHWDALILNDYEMVMPLTWNRKYSIYYLYQPFFSASLGIFGNHITRETVQGFLQNVPAKFRYWDFYLNKDNWFPVPGFPMYARNNFILPLQDEYGSISGKYGGSHLRNIKRALQAGNTVRKDIPVGEVIALAREQTRKFSPVADSDYRNFEDLFTLLANKKMADTYGVYSSENRMVSSCAFVYSHRRAYYILVGNHPDGRTSGASHLMIDHFIREHAGNDLVLDFEGSNIRSLAFFYRNFGAVPEKYPGIKLNRLPAIARLWKK